MKWAITLIIKENNSIERRLESVVSYIIQTYNIHEFLMSDIDATGKMGNQLTGLLNVQKNALAIEKRDISVLMSEPGQIFELDLLLKNKFEYRLIVRSGNSIDILGNGDKLPLTIVGDYEDLDVNLFSNLK